MKQGGAFVRVVLKFVAVGVLTLSCSGSGGSVASTTSSELKPETGDAPELVEPDDDSLSPDTLKAGLSEAPTTTVLPGATTSSSSTQTTTGDVEKQFDLCAPLNDANRPEGEPPIGSITRRCRSSSGTAAFYFVAYPGTQQHLFDDVVMSIFEAAELLPLPDTALSGTAEILVAVWHRFQSQHQEVAEHRCAYLSSESPWCIEDLQEPMISQGIGMSMVDRDPVMFEIVWPTENLHIDPDVSYWLVAAHEWFHVYGLAHTANMDASVEGPAVVPLDGPIWLREGLADYVAALIADHVSNADFVSIYSEWVTQTHNEFATAINVLPSEVLANCTTPASQVWAEEMGGAWQCPAGRVAVLQLLSFAGPDSLERISGYFEQLANVGWEESFRLSFGRSSRVFYEEFGEFLLLPLNEKRNLVVKPAFEPG